MKAILRPLIVLSLMCLTAVLVPVQTTAKQMTGGSSGMWMPTGSMSVARRDHTATLLTNGKVLIVGGLGGGTIAELYDPPTGAFRSTGNALRGHGQNPTATRLLDGRVLIAGGTSSLTFAEIYDPVTEILWPHSCRGRIREHPRHAWVRYLHKISGTV